MTYSICRVTLQNHVTKRFCDIIEGSSSLYRTTLTNLLARVIVVVRHNIVKLSRDLAGQRDQRIFWLYGGKLLIECNNPAMSSGHRHCSSADKVFNLSRGLKWPHVQRFVELCGWKLLIVRHYLPKFDGHRLYCSRDIRDIILQLILQNHMIKGLC